MRTLAKVKREPGIWMTEAPKPTVGPNDVLIRIRKTAICGTDMHIYNWDEWAQQTIPVPMHVGHEYVGVVEAMGEEVRGLRIGQRVSGEGHIVCGHCRNCRAGRRHLCRNTVGVGVNRPGAFADYLVIPAVNAFPIPDDIPDEIAAILDPFGNAAHTALSFDLVGEEYTLPDGFSWKLNPSRDKEWQIAQHKLHELGIRSVHFLYNRLLEIDFFRRCPFFQSLLRKRAKFLNDLLDDRIGIAHSERA